MPILSAAFSRDQSKFTYPATERSRPLSNRNLSSIRLDCLNYPPLLDCNFLPSSPSIQSYFSSYVLCIIVVTLPSLRGLCQRIKTMLTLQGSAKGDFWCATRILARLGVDFEIGDFVGRCSSLVLLLDIPLLRSPQDIPPPLYRRPYCLCSMADDSRQRSRLAEDCKRAILCHCGRKRADIYASAGVSLICLHPTSQPICVLRALLHGFMERQTLFSVILPYPQQFHTTANDSLVLCPCIYDCFIC